MKIFFSVGEPSGDLHGANLIRDLRTLRPDMRAVGFGGPLMEAAGCELQEDLTRMAVMGISRILRNVGTFRRLIREAGEFLGRERPDAVVLIDYPGFNWWVARQAKAHGIPVFYYGPPQMWAWAGWRVRKMRRLVDHVLCKLPFEADWYRARRCEATYVGHPYFDQMSRQVLDQEFLATLRDDQRPLVTILPGSRTQEVQTQLPWFLLAAKNVRTQVPHARVAVASFNAAQAEMARELVTRSGVDAEIHVGRTPELIHAARCCMACSGSVSLELLHHEKPTVILYHVSKLFYRMVWYLLINIKYITLVNLLAVEQPFGRKGKPYDADDPQAIDLPFPEYPTYEDKSSSLARHVVRWLTDETAYQAKRNQLRALKQRFGHPGASRKAAAYIVTALQNDMQPNSVPRAA
jgi:lipid-A-disaccharide synthase